MGEGRNKTADVTEATSQMLKRVLDVGNCGPDHSTIRSFFTRHFDCEVVQAHGPDDTLELLRSGEFDLVLVNRKLDQDYSDGIEIIRLIKSDPLVAAVPVMLVTNYPEHQAAAVAEGALPGFGKLEFQLPQTHEKLAAVLGG
jgi:CheY-like chemotaxis protein